MCAENTLSRDVALRIGLAARELPDTDPGRLMRVLTDAIGLPITEHKLDALKVKDLKTAADNELAETAPAYLKAALACLKGEASTEATPLPTIEAYEEGDMPDSIRVACASNNHEILDGHFGSCQRFLVYQINREQARLIDIRPARDHEAEDGDKNAYRAGLIADCQILYVASIGGPAAAKVVKAGVHPIKQPAVGSARDAVKSLTEILTTSPPPWLAKVMGQTPEQRVRFEREAES